MKTLLEWMGTLEWLETAIRVVAVFATVAMLVAVVVLVLWVLFWLLRKALPGVGDPANFKNLSAAVATAKVLADMIDEQFDEPTDATYAILALVLHREAAEVYKMLEPFSKTLKSLAEARKEAQNEQV